MATILWRVSHWLIRREFERLKALNFDFVKLYVRLPYKWAEEGAAFGHDQMGVQSAGHYLLPAVALGEDGMTHISATSRWGWAYSRSLTGRSYEDVHKLLVDSGMWTITTTCSQAPYAEDPGMATDPRQGIAPPWENKRLVTAVETARHQDFGSAYRHLKDEEVTVADDFRHGGLILAGTDSPLDIPATSLHLNLRARVKFGMAPWQSLETATILPAHAFGLTNDLGTLAPGKLADPIIVSGDPPQQHRRRRSGAVRHGQRCAPLGRRDHGSVRPRQHNRRNNLPSQIGTTQDMRLRGHSGWTEQPNLTGAHQRRSRLETQDAAAQLVLPRCKRASDRGDDDRGRSRFPACSSDGKLEPRGRIACVGLIRSAPWRFPLWAWKTLANRSFEV